MAINLGENPWVLILLTPLELLFIIIPALISSKIERKRFKTSIAEMGLSLKFYTRSELIVDSITGIAFGFTFYLIGGFILSFNVTLVELVFGSEFVIDGIDNVISTTPIEPEIFQKLQQNFGVITISGKACMNLPRNISIFYLVFIHIYLLNQLSRGSTFTTTSIQRPSKPSYLTRITRYLIHSLRVL